MFDLNGKTAVVTGGAGGLGYATALALAREGMKIALWDINGARAEEKAAELRAAGYAAKGWGVDVSDPAAVRASAAAVERELGPVSLLDNNAGIHSPGDFLQATDEQIRRQMEVNIHSYCWCVKAFLPGMIARGDGHLVFIASAAGLLGVPGMAVYSASKYAVVGFAESLRLELRRDGVSGVGMTIVCPSFIDTGMFPNSTPPRFTPWLKPDALAGKIVAAIRANRLFVSEPALVKFIPLLKVLPLSVRDFLCALTGMERSLSGPPASGR